MKPCMLKKNNYHYKVISKIKHMSITKQSLGEIIKETNLSEFEKNLENDVIDEEEETQTQGNMSYSINNSSIKK